MISIIVAVAKNGVIGGDNKLLWHISDDLKNFKRITSGHAVIMGRKTFESLGRALPNRRNVVITRNNQYKGEGIETAGSLKEAVAKCAGDTEVFVIGGGEIYRQAMEVARKLYITEVDLEPEGDTTFPTVDSGVWIETLREQHEGFAFTEYVRR